MPFKSSKQKKWMYANKPAMAKKWSAESKSKLAKMADKTMFANRSK